MDIVSGNKGINNYGATCYLNSVVQCLSHLLFFHPLNNKLREVYDKSKDKSELMKNWLKVNNEIWDNKINNVLDIKYFIKSFQNLITTSNYNFYSFNQNDVEEFLTILFDHLHETIKEKCKLKGLNKSDKEWHNHFKDDNSLIIENFYSQLKLTTTCKHCNYFTDRYEPFMIYSLYIKNLNSVKECLDNKFKNESINDWKCDKCKQVGAINKEILIKIPKFIIIQLKRFDKNNKINTFIKYDDILYIKNTNYKLIGLTIHEGGLHSGHYYAICYNLIDKRWRLYNDSMVRKLNEKEVFNKKAYCLFYKQM